MAITIGQQLGSYEITALLGKGGMGEVYRARDTKLRRDVAIKTLPESFVQDEERMARFHREAQLLASLNHTNIAAIYGFEESQSTRAFVMELVEGPTLADRIAAGPISLEEALPIAGQIANALEYAHERGVIHRDLKPGNIKITTDGHVKVLDFGLAKAIEPSTSGTRVVSPTEGFSNSPTLSLAATNAGMILGTAAYMAPEQARGKRVDQRADIWAFGVLLYEMLTGKPLFRGEDATDVLASVVKEQPNLDVLPVQLRRVIAACLEKDPRNRLQAIGDWKFLLAEERAAAQVGSRRQYGSLLPWIAAIAAVVTLAILALIHFRETKPDERVFQLSVPYPDGSRPAYLQLSPDGRRLLIALFSGNGIQIYLRSRDSTQLQPLAGTDGARSPFWSPDGRFIGFFADGKLKIIPAAGGPTQEVCGEMGLGRGGTWNRDGVILFASQNGPLRRVNATGGDCVIVGKNESDRQPAFPIFLPDGNHYFVTWIGSRPGIYIAALDGGEPKRILADESSVVYLAPPTSKARAHVLFLREQMLMAQPFDESKLESVGDPFVLATSVLASATTPQVAASVSLDGTLAYMSGPSTKSQITWLDRSGAKLSAVGPVTANIGVALSPDGKSFATTRDGENPAIWLYDLDRGSEARFIPRVQALFSRPVWSSDSGSLVVSMDGPEGPGLYAKNVNASQLELLEKSAAWLQRRLSDWSRDGRFLLFTEIDPKTQGDICYVPMTSSKPAGKPVKFLATDANESQAQLSPDGKWLAYASNESGIDQVYIKSFPTGSGTWKVSVDAGRQPRWSSDGKVLYFNGGIIQSRISFMAAAVTPDGRGSLKTENPHQLFEAPASTRVTQGNIFVMSPHPDGQRFLVNMLIETGEFTINVVTNISKLIADRRTDASDR